jgi:hypothetical protein
LFIFIIESAIIISTIGAILMAKYFNKKPTGKEVTKLLDKDKIKHHDEDIVKRYNTEIYFVYENSREVPMKVPKTLAWELKFQRKIAPLGILLLGALLFAIEPFFQ